MLFYARQPKYEYQLNYALCGHVPCFGGLSMFVIGACKVTREERGHETLDVCLQGVTKTCMESILKSPISCAWTCNRICMEPILLQTTALRQPRNYLAVFCARVDATAFVLRLFVHARGIAWLQIRLPDFSLLASAS